MIRIRQFIEYLFLLFFYYLLSLLPVATGSKITGYMCMVLFMSLSRKRKKRLKGQLRTYMNLTERESHQCAKFIYYHFGQNMAELAMIKTMLKKKRFSCPKLPNQDKKGNIYVAAHFSNWEVTGIPSYQSGQKTACVYRHINNPFIDRFVLKRRSKIFTGGCYEKFNVTAMDLAKLINNNINIALVCDERRFNGIKIDFLGHKAYCNTVPALLARRTGADIYTIRANRERNSNYTFVIDKIEVGKNKDKDNTILNVTTKINNIYSNWILSNPSEWWLWNHEKWKQKNEE